MYILEIIIAAIIVALVSSCKKDKDEPNIPPEFISKLTGKWKVQEFSTSRNDTTYYVILLGDSVVFQNTLIPLELHFSKVDPAICSLPFIENIQNWTITKDNENLFLETQDLCGVSNNFNISFGKIQYYELVESDYWGRTVPEHYFAEMRLQNQDTTITTDHFFFWPSSGYWGETMRMEFYFKNGFFILVH